MGLPRYGDSERVRDLCTLITHKSPTNRQKNHENQSSTAGSSATLKMHRICSLLLLIVAVSTVNAAHLYLGNGYFPEAGLRVLDTDTNRIYNVGPLQDADGNNFTTTSLYYHNGTGLLYATPSGRGSNSSYSTALLSIDPATGRGTHRVWIFQFIEIKSVFFLFCYFPSLIMIPELLQTRLFAHGFGFFEPKKKWFAWHDAPLWSVIIG
jgi:hypothetical protein